MASRVVLCTTLLVLAAAVPALAVWPSDGMPVVAATNNQEICSVLPDGGGGAIVVWSDKRSGSLPDIYTQRINTNGVTLWALDGAAVCTHPGNQLNAVAAGDGAGGVIVAWEEYRNGFGDIYAQRIGAGGTALWTTDGVPVCAAENVQVEPRIIPDGSGGAVIAWFDRRSGAFDIYAQRLDASGAVLWPGGVAVCTHLGDQKWVELAGDGAGNVFAAWEDYRGGGFSDVYAQRLDLDGNPGWTAGGVAVCTDTLGQGPVDLTPDGSGGAIVVWSDSRSGVEDIYAQRVDDTGTAAWTAGGVVVCDAASSQLEPLVVSDGGGGAIVAWTDFRDVLTSPDVYAQRIDGGGTAQWTALGVKVSGAVDWQYLSDSVSDGAGGVFLAWADDRGTETDVYVQQLDGNGNAQWTVDGEPLCTATGYQFDARIAASGSGCAIVAWTDTRGGDYDVMALNAGACTPSAVVTPSAPGILHLGQNYPNPFTGTTRFEFELESEADATVEVFDVLGRRIYAEHRGRSEPGVHRVEFNRGRSLPAGVYYYRVTAAGVSETRKMVLVR
jgi:hypothetical protein